MLNVNRKEERELVRTQEIPWLIKKQLTDSLDMDYLKCEIFDATMGLRKKVNNNLSGFAFARYLISRLLVSFKR